jgi:hypothetical protein
MHPKTKEFFSLVTNGDYEACNALIASYDAELLNSQDIFGTTALHLALKYGHENLVELLLNQPEINPNLQAYQHTQTGNTYSPLDFAFKYDSSPKIAKLLLDANATTQHPDALLKMIIGGEEGKCPEGSKEPIDPQELREFLHVFEKLVTKIPEIAFLEGWPLSIRLIGSYHSESDAESRMVLQNLIEILSKSEANEYVHPYLVAKDFTHAFPSSNEYFTINELVNDSFQAGGYLKSYPLKSFHDSFVDYQNNLISLNHHQDISNYGNFKNHIFSEINASYTLAESYADKSGLQETSNAFYNLYEEGQTILLRSGWDEHAVDVILDKSLNLYIVANAGDRYLDLPPGIRAYNNNVPITADSISKILNNGDQHQLEYDQFYDLQLTENPIFSQDFPNQEYGNCGLNSLLLANWSLTYLNLYKDSVNPLEAKLMANNWHNDVVEHHKTVVLKNYLAEPYLKGDQVLYDTLIHHEKKLDHPEKIVQTNLILNYLTSEGHSETFTKYYEEHLDEFSLDLNQVIKLYGYKDKIIDPHNVLEGADNNLNFPKSDADLQVVAQLVMNDEPIAPPLLAPVISIEQPPIVHTEWALA